MRKSTILNALCQSLDAGYAVINSDIECVMYNDQFHAFFKLKDEKDDVNDFVEQKFKNRLIRLFKDPTIQKFSMKTLVSQTPRWFSIRISRIEEDAFIVVEDITRERYEGEYLKHLALIDPLTGLSNRAHYMQEMEDIYRRAVKEESPIAVMLIDLDDFKEVNDTLGHAAGDFVLSSISERLTDVIADAGLVARLGGDEFSIVFKEKQSQEFLQTKAEEIVKISNKGLNYKGSEVSVSCSIGICLCMNVSTAKIMDIMKSADLSMFKAKKAGKNKYDFVLLK